MRVQIAGSRSTGDGLSKQEAAGAGALGFDRCTWRLGQLDGYQDGSIHRLHVPGVHAAAVQPGVQDQPGHRDWQWHQLLDRPCLLHVRVEWALHQH